MLRKHVLPVAVLTFALTFLGCDMSLVGPDIAPDLPGLKDLKNAVAFEQVAFSAGASALGSTCVAPRSAVSWWPGEDSFDYVSGTNPIVRYSGVTFAPGVVGQGFRFDQGLGQPFIEIDDSPTLRPASFTVDFWAQRFSAGQNNDAVVGNILVQKNIMDSSFSGPVVSYFISWRADDRIVAGVYFEDDDFPTGAVPVRLVGTSVHPFGSVVHVALSFDGTAATLYINGTPEDTFDATGRPPVAYGPGAMVVGAAMELARRFGYGRSPDGVIDELEIFDFALAPEQIQAIHDTGGACKIARYPDPDESPPAAEVTVDIKPGSNTNPINIGGKSTKSGKSAKGKKSAKSSRRNANVPVAILTTDVFDAATVDAATVTLGASMSVGVTVKKNGTLQASFKDVDDDGDLDLVMHFRIADLVAAGDLDDLTTELCLDGLTFGGDAINSCDDVTIVGG